MSEGKLRIGLSVLLVIVVFAGRQAAVPTNTGAPTKAAPQSESELRALVAPIALYPDNLVGEVLAGSTFPDQIAVANYWIQQHKDLKGNALVQAVDKQSWNE